MSKFFRHIVLGFVMLVSVSTYAQQDPLFTQYMNNPGLINPAYVGSFSHVNVNAIMREQWIGVDWRPTTISVSVGSPFYEYKVGVGFTMINDQIGPLSQTGIYFDYAYHIEINPNSRFSLGLKSGFNYFQKDLRPLSTFEFDYWVNSSPQFSKFLWNTGIGAYYYNNFMFAGVSVPKLFRNSLNSTDVVNYEVVGREERHVYFTAGSVFDINPILKLKPTLMYRMVSGAPFSIETTATLIFYERLWTGLSYRFGGAIGVHARFEIQPGIQIGYSFDYNNSRLVSHNSGSHELFFSYTIVPRGERILSPRYF
jgi:type IX secretion system PorP/SprF family membrane protein